MDNYPNKLEKILGVVFLASMLSTSISSLADLKYNQISTRTYKLFSLTLVSGYGAFRRENTPHQENLY